MRAGVDRRDWAAAACRRNVFLILARAVRAFLFGEGDFERVVALGCVGSIVAILLHSFADFNLYIPANALFFSVILGLGIALRSPHSIRRIDAI